MILSAGVKPISNMNTTTNRHNQNYIQHGIKKKQYFISLMCLQSVLPSNVAFPLYPPQGTEPEEADLPADSLLWPLWPIRIYLGAAQKALLLNTSPARPDRFARGKTGRLFMGHDCQLTIN